MCVNAALATSLAGCVPSTTTVKLSHSIEPRATKKVFREMGTCSRTFLYFLNREFGHQNELAEVAADPLAGGIMTNGYQCGMLWGASLVVGAEAIGQAIAATQNLVNSFHRQEESIDCQEITNVNLISIIGITLFILFKTKTWFNLAEQWAPKAVRTANENLVQEDVAADKPCMSCASEVVFKMGASEEEQPMAAGFVGGLGLSGNACGALAAAIWLNSLAWCKEQNQTHPEEKVTSAYGNPKAKAALKVFLEVTDSIFRCDRSQVSNSSHQVTTALIYKAAAAAI